MVYSNTEPFENQTLKRSVFEWSEFEPPLYMVLEPVYSNHPNTGLVWYSNGRFVSGCQMVRYLNGGLKTGQKKILFLVQNVWYWNGSPSQVTLPFEYQTPRLSDIQVLGIQMDTVESNKLDHIKN